jgi:hypothetical protein
MVCAIKAGKALPEVGKADATVCASVCTEASAIVRYLDD